MKSLVLGANGFLGSHLVDALAARGEAVRAFLRPGRTCQWVAQPKMVEACFGDFANPADLEPVLGDVGIAYVCIGTSLPQTSNQCPQFDVETSILPFLRFLDGCVAARVRKVVFLSSGGTVYGIPRSNPISEDHPTDPICSYGITRLAIEKYLALYFYLHGLEYCILRLSNPFGERQNSQKNQGVITAWLRRIAQGEESIDIWGDGSVVRDYFFVGDAVEAIIRCAAYDGPEKLFNIGSGVGRSLLEVFREIQAVCEPRIEARCLPGRACDVPVNVLDVARVERVVGWKAETAFQTALQKTWDSFRSQAY